MKKALALAMAMVMMFEDLLLEVWKGKQRQRAVKKRGKRMRMKQEVSFGRIFFLASPLDQGRC